MHAMTDEGGKSMDLGVWNENESSNEIWKNDSLSGYVDFFPKFRQKITGLGIWNRFGTDLAIPNIWSFGRLGERTNFGRLPLPL